MSLRTTPSAPSASGPLEPSPGNGPAVSSGMVSQPAAAADPVLSAGPPAEVEAVVDEAEPSPSPDDPQPTSARPRPANNCRARLRGSEGGVMTELIARG